MDWLQALILGIVQGLTEFLPVSSSGHIELVKALFGSNIEEGLTLSLTLHLATALSTVVIFRKDIVEVFKGLFQFTWNEETKFSWYIVLSMIPAVLVGLFFKDTIENLFNANVPLVCAMLVITGVVLYWSDQAKNPTGEVNGLKAFIVGVIQAIAILPGISRSGSTIGSSVLLGVERSKAAKFSFLMVLPVIMGAAAKDFLDIRTEGIGDLSISFLAIAFISAFVVGIFACQWMIAIVKQSKLRYFSYYCWAVALIGFAWYFFK